MASKGFRAEETGDKQERIYELIVSHIDEYGYPPTHQWLAEQTGMVKSNVHYHLMMLERDGWIERDTGRSRGIRIAKSDGV